MEGFRDSRVELDEGLLAGRGFNYYQALGVSPHSSSREIREAYRQTVRMARPERLDQSTSAYYRYLNDALDVLTDVAARQAYDETLGDVETMVARRFSPSSVAMPHLGASPHKLLPKEDVKVVPRGVGKFLGVLASLLALAGLMLSAVAIPASDNSWVVGAWLALVAVSSTFLHFHPNVKSPVLSRTWVGYAFVMFVFVVLVFGDFDETILAVLAGGALTTLGLVGVAESWRKSHLVNGGTKRYPLSQEFIVTHKELGTAGESWRGLARKGKVPQASLTKETFTQQMTADILMRLTTGSGVRLINGVDVGTFIPHVLVAGNCVAIVEGIIVESNEQSITSRGVIISDDNDIDNGIVAGVPAAVPLMESMQRKWNVRGWIILIPRDGGKVKVSYKGGGGKVKMGEAHTVLKEISEFFSEDKAYNVLDLRVINALWSRKTAE